MSKPELNKPELATGVYRHYKGNNYQVIDIARHSETDEWMVIYKPLYNDSGLWVRPYSMFIENVIIKGKAIPRFAKVGI